MRLRHALQTLLFTVAIGSGCPDSADEEADGVSTGEGGGGTDGDGSGPQSAGPDGDDTEGGSSGSSTTGMGETGGSADETDSANSSDGSGGVTTSCDCPLDEAPSTCEFSELHMLLPDCALPSPCDVVTVSCPGGDPDLTACAFEEFEYDEAALQCVLEAARDGTPGRFDLVNDEGGGVSTLWLDGSGNALALTCVPTRGAVDIFGGPQSVADASHFTMCLDLETPAAWDDCYRAGFLPSDRTCE